MCQDIEAGAAACAWFGGELAGSRQDDIPPPPTWCLLRRNHRPVNEQRWAYGTELITSNDDAPNDRASNACSAIAPIGHASIVAIARQ